MIASIVVLFTIVMIVLIIVMAKYDYKTLHVPNFLIYMFNSSSIGFSMLMGKERLVLAVIGFGICALAGYIMYQYDLWGGADARILAGVGGYFGISMALATYLFILILGTYIFSKVMDHYKLKKAAYVPVMAISFVMNVLLILYYGGF